MGVLCLGVTIFGMVCLTMPVWATTVLEKSFAELVDEADIIVVGTVSAIETEEEAASEVPFTFVTFTSLEILKGETARTELTLRFLGGPRPDGTVLQIAGVPQFAVGERSILFVTGNDHLAVPLVGFWQGVYRVVFDPDRDTDTVYTHTMQPLTALPTGGGTILHDDGHADHQPHSLHSAEPLSLESFSQSVEQEVHRD